MRKITPRLDPDSGFGSPEPDTGIIYLYRVGSMVGGNNVFYLFANDEAITRIGNGGYYPYVSPPGNVTFSTRLRPSAAQRLMAVVVAARKPQDMITIPVEAGEVYYVRFDYYGRAGLVEREKGEEEIRGLKQFEPERE